MAMTSSTRARIRFGPVLLDLLKDLERWIDLFERHYKVNEEDTKRVLLEINPHDVRRAVRAKILPPLAHQLEWIEANLCKKPLVPDILINGIKALYGHEKTNVRMIYASDIGECMRQLERGREMYCSVIHRIKKIMSILLRFGDRHVDACDRFIDQYRPLQERGVSHRTPMQFYHHVHTIMITAFLNIRKEIAVAKKKFARHVSFAPFPHQINDEAEQNDLNMEPIGKRLRSRYANERMDAEPICKRLRSRNGVIKKK